MKNKKGMTLIELIVSVILVSVIVIFLFRLLIDLRNEENKSNSKPTYKITQTIINKNIQNVLLNETVINVESISTFGERSVKLTLANNRYLTITISNNNQVITVQEIDELAEMGNDVILYERRQLPESVVTEGEGKKYLGKVGDFTVTSYTTTTAYKYNKMLVIKFPLIDNALNNYWIEAYYPYNSSTEILSTPINLLYE